MKSLHVCMLVLSFVLVACGDSDNDSSIPAKSENNANGQTNLNNSNSGQNNSTNSTNSSENNTANNDGNNVSTNNATSSSTNNTGETNNSNNVTNNQTMTDPTGTMSCMDILGCLLGCHADDDECEAQCRELGNEEAKTEIDAFLGCVDFH